MAAAMLLALAACDLRPSPPPRSPGTRAAEAKAGDFADYYSEVVRLSRVHAAQPDSFRAAVAALPGSRLTDEEWDAWVAPYRDRPERLAVRLEEVISTVAPAE